MKNKILTLTTLSLMYGCSSGTNDNYHDCVNQDGSGGTNIPTEVTVNGAVEKGMFIQGSDISINLVDALGQNIGSVYNTQTNDDFGNFSTTLAGLNQNYTGNLSLSSTGFYFQEYAGELSSSQQTLKALFVSQGVQEQIHVNIMTHLSYLRSSELVSNGNLNLSQAITQSQQELIASLALAGLISPGQGVKGTEMYLFGQDNAKNSYLLATSCVFENATGSSSASLQQLLNQYQGDFSDDGSVSSQLTDKIHKALRKTNPKFCLDNLQIKAQDSNKIFNLTEVGVNSVLDADLDGIPNSQDTDFQEVYCNAGLCWERNPDVTTKSFDQINAYCNNLQLNGKSDWKMPDIEELRTLVEGCAHSETTGICSIDNNSTQQNAFDDNCNSCSDDGFGSFEGTPGINDCYWSEMINGECDVYLSNVYNFHNGQTNTDTAFGIDFSSAKISLFGTKSDNRGICVRDDI